MAIADPNAQSLSGIKNAADQYANSPIYPRIDNAKRNPALELYVGVPVNLKFGSP